MATPVTVAEYPGNGQPAYANGPFKYGSNLFALWIDFATARWCASKSTDNGASWSTISTSGPIVQKIEIVFVGAYRLWEAASVLDGTSVHIFYPKDSTGTVTHSSFDLTTEGWGAEDDSGEELSGQQPPTLAYGYGPISACRVSAGRCFVAFLGYDAGVPDVYMKHMFYDSGWSAAYQYIDQLWNSKGLSVAANTDRIHLVFWRYVAAAAPEVCHYAISPDGLTVSARTTLSVTGGVFDDFIGDVRTWTYQGTSYFAFPFQDVNVLRVLLGVSSDAPTVTSKAAYTKAVDEQTNVGNNTHHRLIPVEGSLHLVHQRFLLASTNTRLYETCIPFTQYEDLLVPWSTSELIADLNTATTWLPSTTIDAYENGNSIIALCAASSWLGMGSANGFVRSVSFTLTPCDCCCSDGAFLP